MNKMLVIAGLAAALVLPAGAVAKPDQSERRAAKSQCKDERGKTSATREAFRSKYRGFVRCVRQNAAEEDAENKTARSHAVQECRDERSEDPEAFREAYGTNGGNGKGSGRNAFGKCVSGKAKQNKAEMDAEDEQEAEEFKNAAKECAAERDEMGREEFAEEHGTNANNRNAFGKCVSKKTRES